MESAAATAEATAGPQVGLGTLFVKFLTIGAISFGGGIVAYLQRMLVDDTHWLTKDEFLAYLEVSQTLPGTNSVNMAVLVGDRFHGRLGALVAFAGLVLPGSVLVFLIAVGSERGRHHPILHAALTGVTAGAVGILAGITFNTGKQQFTRFPDLLILIATFVGMAFLRVPLLVLVVVLGGLSVYLYRPRKASHE